MTAISCEERTTITIEINGTDVDCDAVFNIDGVWEAAQSDVGLGGGANVTAELISCTLGGFICDREHTVIIVGDGSEEEGKAEVEAIEAKVADDFEANHNDPWEFCEY